MRIGFLIAGLAVAVVIIGAIQWFSAQPETSSEDPPVEVASPTPPTPPTPTAVQAPAAETVEAAPEEPAVQLPDLNDSDDFIRAQLATYELPQEWLAAEELARRAAVVVDNAARGEVAIRQLSFMSISSPFGVLERGGELYLDPANYQRYDPLVEQLLTIPPAAAAELLQLLTPLVVESLAELGNQRTPREQLLQAIDQILAVPVRRNDIRLIQPKVLYEYAEPRLENLTPLQKQVLRTGPDNTEKLQDYVGRLRPLL
jgi:hypothetical protein